MTPHDAIRAQVRHAAVLLRFSLEDLGWTCLKQSASEALAQLLYDVRLGRVKRPINLAYTRALLEKQEREARLRLAEQQAD